MTLSEEQLHEVISLLAGIRKAVNGLLGLAWFATGVMVVSHWLK